MGILFYLYRIFWILLNLLYSSTRCFHYNFLNNISLLHYNNNWYRNYNFYHKLDLQYKCINYLLNVCICFHLHFYIPFLNISLCLKVNIWDQIKIHLLVGMKMCQNRIFNLFRLFYTIYQLNLQLIHNHLNMIIY